MSIDGLGDACPFTNPERIFDDLAAVRRSGHLPFSEAYGARMVTHYDDIVAALHAPATYSSVPTVPELPSPWRERFLGRVPDRGTLLGIDNPDHDRLRSSVNTFFMPRRLARYESWIETEAHRLIDTFVETGASDLKTTFALPMPLRVISHIVGLDVDRAEWVSAALGFFMGPRDIYHPGTPESKAELLLELHDHLLVVMAERKVDRRDDLISHIWDQRDAGVVDMTDFEMLSMFPGLMLAGHETSSNLLCIVLSHLLTDEKRYEAAQRDEATRAATLEEMFRYESAITGMRRRVTTDTELGGEPLRAGEVVFLAYASGSRDITRFEHPDTFDADRTWGSPHLGFGQGVHACLGAPLARLLLRVELRVLYERLPELHLAVPYEQLAHTEVSEGRGIVALPVAWTPAQPRLSIQTPTAATSKQTLSVTVTGRRALTSAVVELTLVPTDASPPPVWEPGAHIDLELPDGALRQYSLCGDVGADNLRIAVLRETNGRGGSRAVHQQVRVGDSLAIRGPRNHFRLRTSERYVFVAGGIGITPLLPMIAQAERESAPWKLHYLGRSRETMVYLHDLTDAYGARITPWPSTRGGRFDLTRIWTNVDDDTLIYACGPEGLLVDLEDAARGAGRERQLVVERFAPRRVAHEPNRSFTVELARRGITIEVAAHDSVLDAVNRRGANILSTCREGTCGTCEVGVLDGVPEHRDSVLTVEERLANDTMMTCVSRCRGSQLLLDL